MLTLVEKKDVIVNELICHGIFEFREAINFVNENYKGVKLEVAIKAIAKMDLILNKERNK